MKNETVKKKKTFENSLKGSRFWGVLVFIVLIIIDQITKMVADVFFNMQGAPNKIGLIPNILELEMSYNRGIAFGALGDSSPVVKLCIVVITAILMAILTLVYWKMDKNRTIFRWALVLIVAGGIGNLIDRVNYQVWDPNTYMGGVQDGVRDFVHVMFIIDFECCNFADFFIVAGVIMMILAMLFCDTNALWPQGKYKELARIETQKEEQKKREAIAKKNKKYTQGE